MSQIFPKNKFKASEVISKDEVNENLRGVVGEIQGNLGEQNWAKDTFETANIDSNAVARVHYKYVEAPRAFLSSSPNTYQFAAGTTGYGRTMNHVRISTNRTWTTLLSFNVTVRSSLVWIMASFQQDYYSPSTRDRYMPGATYAIAVDGGRIHETVIGSLDRSNDRRGESYRYWKNPFATDVLIPLSAGTHTISLEGRMVATTDYKNFSDSDEAYVVGNRELIIVEMT